MYNLIMEGFFMSKNNMKISKGYSIMWLVFTAIYAVWMCFFMKADTYPHILKCCRDWNPQADLLPDLGCGLVRNNASLHNLAKQISLR